MPKDLKLQKRNELIHVIQDYSGYVVEIDGTLPAMIRHSNGSCCKPNIVGTDVYFHVIDPRNGKILSYHDENVSK